MLRHRSIGLHLFADRPFDFVGKTFADAVYGLQLAAACRNNGFHTAESIQKPAGFLKAASRQSLQNEKLIFPFIFRSVAVPVYAAPGH